MMAPFLSFALLKGGFLLLLAALVSAQPPQPNGQGAEFLTALDPVPGDPPPIVILDFPGAPPPRPQNALSDPPRRKGPNPPPNCSTQVCRDLTGVCTSTRDPTWGEARRTQFSYLPGHSSTLPNGEGLKSAREISNILSAQDADMLNSRRLNELLVFFGQFLDHNLVATPTDSRASASFPISIPEGDPFFPAGGTLPFQRSIRGRTGEGRNQRPINTLPSAVDLVAVYGPDLDRNTALLEFNGGGITGKMKTSAGDLLPLNMGEFVNAPNITPRFFLAGDHRANEHPVLTGLHTIFVREHNRICDIIKKDLPFLSGEKLYEYTRKVNIAQFQKIVFDEFYRAIAGRRLPPYRGFKMNVNPTVSDIFAGAGFRVGHTMVGNMVNREGPGGPRPPLTMAKVFFRPASAFSSGELEDVIRGAEKTRAQEVDLKVVNILRNMLFDKVKGEEGFDLVALNIQRGRDHALPSYNEIRRIFGMKTCRTFSCISRDPQTQANLEEAYGVPDNVEAWPGLVGENRAPNSSLGRTMLKLWAAEFIRLRDGDQFFFLRQQKYPAVLRRILRQRFSDLFKPQKKIFKDIIIRNSGITAAQLGPESIFTV